jgi:peptidoglycan hydrolase CwlO-like protein
MWIVIALAFLMVIIVLASAASRKKPANEATRSAQRIATAESRLDELSSTQNALKEELTNYKNDAEELREFRKHTTNFVTLLAAAAWQTRLSMTPNATVFGRSWGILGSSSILPACKPQ